MIRGHGRRCADRGSAVVEFVLVAPLLLALAVAVLQVVLTVHVRAVLTSAAAEGARAAALAGADPAAGVARARQLLNGTLAGSVVVDVRAQDAVVAGLPLQVVEVDARVPLVGLLAPVTMSVQGRALQEGA